MWNESLPKVCLSFVNRHESRVRRIPRDGRRCGTSSGHPKPKKAQESQLQVTVVVRMVEYSRLFWTLYQKDERYTAMRQPCLHSSSLRVYRSLLGTIHGTSSFWLKYLSPVLYVVQLRWRNNVTLGQQRSRNPAVSSQQLQQACGLQWQWLVSWIW